MNLSDAKVVSADVPSGVETDTGRILGDAVRADVTVTFSMAKPGLFVGKGALRAGKVVVHDIGIPEDILGGETFDTHVIDGGLVRSWLPRRPADGGGLSIPYFSRSGVCARQASTSSIVGSAGIAPGRVVVIEPAALPKERTSSSSSRVRLRISARDFPQRR